MKVKPRKLPSKEKERTLRALEAATNALRGRSATQRFIRDLLTESERIMLGRRILIARELLAGARHDDIARSMNVGYDTIARVQEWLSEQIPEYKKVIKEVRAELRQGHRKTGKKVRLRKIYNDDTWKGTIARLKTKYPLHFLLVPWPTEHRPEN